MSGVKESPDLAEVKAVLRRLQRLDVPGSESPDSNPASRGAAGTVSIAEDSSHVRARMSVFDRKRAAVGQTEAEPRTRSHKAIYFSLAGALAAAGVLVFYKLPKGPAELKTVAATTAPLMLPEQKQAAPVARMVQPVGNEAAVAVEARSLLSGGEVASARSRLMGAAPENSANLALLLAQSYDSNYLRTLPKTDSAPDRVQAERWYRTWYELAARSGLEMDNARFQRIIKSLQ